MRTRAARVGASARCGSAARRKTSHAHARASTLHALPHDMHGIPPRAPRPAPTQMSWPGCAFQIAGLLSKSRQLVP